MRLDGASLALRLLDHLGDRERLALGVADADHAVHVHALRRHFFDRDDVGVVVELVGGVDHLREAAALVLHQHVGQQQRERLVADQFARAPDRMAEAERRLLAGEAGGARLRQVLRQQRELGLLAALVKRQLELELAVEMVLDHALVAAGDEDEMLDAGLRAPRRPRAGSAAGRPPAAFPSAWPWSPAGSGCRGRRREIWLCGCGSCGICRYGARGREFVPVEQKAWLARVGPDAVRIR